MKKVVLMFLIMIPVIALAQKDKADFSDFNFEIKNIKAIGEELIINMMVTNKGENEQLHMLIHSTRMFDANGKEFKCTQSKLGNTNSSYVLKGDLLKDVPVKAQLIFKGIPATRDKIVALEIPVVRASNRNESKLQFNNLSIPYKAKNFDSPDKKEVVEDVFMKIKDIRQDGELLVIDYMITNKGDELLLPIELHSSRLIDDEGKEYKIEKATLSKEKSSYVLKNTLITDVPLSGSIYFKTGGKVNSIALFELSIKNNIHRLKNLKVEK